MSGVWFGSTTDVAALTGGSSTNFVLMKFGGCRANAFFSVRPRPPDFLKESKGPREKKRQQVSVGRRKRPKIRGGRSRHEIPAKRATCSTAQASQAGGSIPPQISPNAMPGRRE